MEIEVEDDTTLSEFASTSILTKCQDKLRGQIEHMDVIDAIDSFTSCAHPLMSHEIEAKNKEIGEQEELRMKIGTMWEDYTCLDFKLPTTTPQIVENWSYHGKDHEVGVLLDRDEAKIHYVKNFITQEECATIEAAAAPSLHRATVADGSGGSHLQNSRKAMQVGAHVPWEKETDGDLIAAISRKLYQYVNEVTGYNIQIEGQEDLMSIQYEGRGLNDPEPDRYMPHCDG